MKKGEIGLKIHICVLESMFRPYPRKRKAITNLMVPRLNLQHAGYWFLIHKKCKLGLKNYETWHGALKWHQHVVIKI